MFEEIRCIVHGRVQAVGYRDFVQRNAKEHSVIGVVENKPDGTVEVIAQGTPDDLKEFIERLHEGSVLANVNSVSVEWRSPTKRFEDFTVIF
jgi:acylphosphatase